MTASINAANFLMLSVFGIAAVGYLLGRITIKGISLGTAGVFVIALVYGAFFGTRFNSRFVIEEINYASQALKIIENLGLVFFVTSVGFIAGPNFFKNMKHNFKSYVLLGVVIILSGGLTAILCLLVGRAIESGQPGYDPGQLTAMISGLLAGSDEQRFPRPRAFPPQRRPSPPSIRTRSRSATASRISSASSASCCSCS